MKTATAPLPPLRSVKVLDQLRERIRYLHYSLRTEQAYVNWVRAFIRFHGVRHPATLGSSEVEAFLSWLANERKVSVSTHRQALAALLFFYGKVLCTDLPLLQEIGRPRPSRRLPVVLTPDEVVRILGFLEGEHRLFAQDSSYSSSGWLRTRSGYGRACRPDVGCEPWAFTRTWGLGWGKGRNAGVLVPMGSRWGIDRVPALGPNPAFMNKRPNTRAFYSVFLLPS